MKMGRKHGDTDLSAVRKRRLLFAVQHTDRYNSQSARAVRTTPSAVANVRKRAREADKENIDPEDLVDAEKPCNGRPNVLRERDECQPIRHATNNSRLADHYRIDCLQASPMSTSIDCSRCSLLIAQPSGYCIRND